MYMAKGKGCYLTDVDGVTRIDCGNNMSSLIHGHSNPEVVQAVQAQSANLLSVGAPTQVEVDLARVMVDRVDSVKQVRFTNSGSEAMMFACRLARAVTGRNKIAKLEGAYHGSYDAVEFSLNPDPSNWGPLTSPAAVPATSGLTPGVQADTIVLPINEIDATREILRHHEKDLAGVVIDPLVSRMGFVAASRAWLAMIQDFTKQSGVALILDEVFSFRLSYGGSQELFGLEPDLSVFGKVIGGGLPIGAVGGSRRFMQAFDHEGGSAAVEHSGTFFANPLSMAAGKAALDQLTPVALDRLNGLGNRLRQGLANALKTAGVDGYVNGAGSLAAIVLGPRISRNYRDWYQNVKSGSLQKSGRLHRQMMATGVQIVPMGGYILSTAMSETVIDEIIDCTLNGLREIEGLSD
jgi:glutamate-1-semialdehyde 2,1-aminomutase